MTGEPWVDLPVFRRLLQHLADTDDEEISCTECFDLVRAHSVEEIIPRIMFTDVVEAQPAPMARSVEVRRRQRRTKLSRLLAAAHGAGGLRSFHPPMPF